MADLTVGVLVTDKDEEYLGGLLERLSSKISGIDFEVLVYDNRENSVTPLETAGAAVIGTGGGNIRQLAARKHIIENASGDYVWFVDADDDIFEIDGSYLTDADMTVYSRLIRGDDKDSWCEQEPLSVEGNESVWEHKGDVRCCLWDKIIKTEILRQVISYVDDDDRVSASEDAVYVIGAFRFAESLRFDSRYIYTYYASRSSSAIEDYSDCYEKYEACFYGIERAREILKEMADYEQEDCCFFLQKIGTTKSSETRQLMMARLQQSFTKEQILSAWKTSLYNGGPYVIQEDFLNLVKILYEQYSDEIYLVQHVQTESTDISGEKYVEETSETVPITWEGNPIEREEISQLGEI